MKICRLYFDIRYRKQNSLCTLEDIKSVGTPGKVSWKLTLLGGVQSILRAYSKIKSTPPGKVEVS